jgi:hypothetical protein
MNCYYCMQYYMNVTILPLGIASCVLALGFEKMEKGSLRGKV